MAKKKIKSEEIIIESTDQSSTPFLRLIPMPFANDITNVISPDTLPNQDRLSYPDGVPTVEIYDGIKPIEQCSSLSAEEFNGALQDVTTNICAYQNGEQYTFDPNWVAINGGYAKGAVLWSEPNKSFLVSAKNKNKDNFIVDRSSVGVTWGGINAGSLAPYSSSLSYANNDIVCYLDTTTMTYSIYQSLIDDNINNPADSLSLVPTSIVLIGGVAYMNGVYYSLANYSSIYGEVYSSTDGVTWIKISDSSFSDICYSSGKLWACGNNGIYSSANGVIWDKSTVSSSLTQITSNDNGDILAVNAYAEFGVVLLKSGTALPAQMFTFENIQYTWAICAFNNKFLVTFSDMPTNNRWVYVTDENMIFQKYAINISLASVVYMNGVLYGVASFGMFNPTGGLGVYSSIDGVTWKKLSNLPGGATEGVRASLVNVGNILALGFLSYVYYSIDGINWIFLQATQDNEYWCASAARKLFVGMSINRTASSTQTYATNYCWQKYGATLAIAPPVITAAEINIDEDKVQQQLIQLAKSLLDSNYSEYPIDIYEDLSDDVKAKIKEYRKELRAIISSDVVVDTLPELNLDE